MRSDQSQYKRHQMPMRSLVLLVGILNCTVWWGLPVWANPPHTGVGNASTKNPPYSRRQWRHQRKSHELAFNSVRQSLLHDLLLGQCKEQTLLDDATRYALHRQGSIPPGVQRQVCKGKALPPGLSKQVVLLPQEVNRYLGLQSSHEVRVGVLGEDVLLYNTASGLILDILKRFL